jgi:hypothetical protein
MPNPEARAAFDDAQRLAGELKQIQDQAEAINDTLKRPNDSASETQLHGELRRMWQEWDRLFSEYCNAMQRYTLAVEVSRRKGSGPL